MKEEVKEEEELDEFSKYFGDKALIKKKQVALGQYLQK
jgi:hypothetical protein